MATPVGDSYTVPPGGAIAAGRNYVLPVTALMGDSLTDPTYSLSPVYWGNGLTGGKLQLIANSGVSGNTVSAMAARLANAYTDATPGLAGLPPLGRIIVRAGTNDARNNTPIASLASTYTSFLGSLAALAQRVIILAVPPLAGAYIAQNPRTIEYNAWLAAYAQSSPGVFSFIDDCVNVRDGSGGQIASYFSDGTHMNRTGVYRMGLDLAAGLAPHVAGLPSPLSTDASDVYPAHPQWIANPTNTGTSGSKGANVSGSVVTGASVSIGGASSALCSIVAADVGDSNQVAWQRIEPLTGSAGGSVTASLATSGRAMSSVDPYALDAMVEIRFNSLDMAKLDFMQFYQQANTTEFMVPKAYLHMGGVSGQSGVAVLRHKIRRSGSSSPASAQTYIELRFLSAFASSVGSFDFRCCTIRG